MVLFKYSMQKGFILKELQFIYFDFCYQVFLLIVGKAGPKKITKRNPDKAKIYFGKKG